MTNGIGDLGVVILIFLTANENSARIQQESFFTSLSEPEINFLLSDWTRTDAKGKQINEW